MIKSQNQERLLQNRKNESGFMSLFFGFMFSVISLMIIAFGFVYFTTEAKTKTRSFCFIKLLEIQEVILREEFKLIKLNPLALKYRLEMRTLRIELNAALASKNAALIMLIERNIALVKSLQKTLSIQQNSIIQNGEVMANIMQNLAFDELRREQLLHSKIWSSVVKSTQYFFLTNPMISFQLESDQKNEIAPLYQKKPNFEFEQTLGLVWQFSFFENTIFQKLLKNINQSWSFKCQIVPKSIELEKIDMKVDKPL